MAERTGPLIRRLDPINWEVSSAAWILIGVIVLFAALESLPIGVWAGRAVMWLTLALIVTVICRVQQIRYRDLATLVVPAILLLAATSFAADPTLQLISTFVIFFGAIAIPFFPRSLVAWIGYVAPDYYRSIAAADEATADAFAQARKAVNDQLVASASDPAKVTETASAARESVRALGSLDEEWESVRALFLRYLDWYSEVTEPTAADWADCRARLDALTSAYETLRKSRSQFVGHRLLAAPSPSAAESDQG